MRKLTLYLSLLFAGAMLFAQEGKIETNRDKKLGYISTATFNFDKIFAEDMKETLADLSSYREWVPIGLDGKDKVSSKYWGQIETLIFDETSNIMDFRYAVNLPWPFGSKNNSILLQTSIKEEENLTSVEFGISNKSAAIKSGVVRLSIIDIDDKSARLEIYGQVDFTFLIDLFLTDKVYKKSTESKILTLAANLLEYGRAKYAERLNAEKEES